MKVNVSLRGLCGIIIKVKRIHKKQQLQIKSHRRDIWYMQFIYYILNNLHSMSNFFWIGYFIVALTARSYRDCHWFSVWEWYFLLIYWTPQQSHMRFFVIQCSHRVTSATWTTMSSGNTICHERHLSGRVQCSHRATAVSSVVTGPHQKINHEIRQPTIWVHITLPSVGELKH